MATVKSRDSYRVCLTYPDIGAPTGYRVWNQVEQIKQLGPSPHFAHTTITGFNPKAFAIKFADTFGIKITIQDDKD